MFNVIISFGPGPTQWQLMFEDHENARSVLHDFQDGKPAIAGKDSFGSEFSIETSKINGVLIEDLNKTGDAAIERQLYQLRANAKGQSKASTDPVLRFSGANTGMAMPMHRS